MPKSHWHVLLRRHRRAAMKAPLAGLRRPRGVDADGDDFRVVVLLVAHR